MQKEDEKEERRKKKKDNATIKITRDINSTKNNTNRTKYIIPLPSGL